jgi:hypothetical protein
MTRPPPAADPGAAWVAEASSLLAALPDDTQLVAVDLHS